MKKLLLLLVLLAAGALFGAGALLGLVVRSGVASAGTAAFGTKTTVASAHVSLLGETVALSGLEVAQPPGFTTGRGILIERIDLAASWRNLLADPAAVRSIDLQSPEITLEVGTGGTSVGKLIENLRSRRGTSRRLHVDTVRVVKPRLRLAQSLLVKIERTIDVPGFELTDVSAGGDVTLADLLLKVLARMLTQAGLPPEVAAVLGKDEAVRALQDPIEGVKRLLDDALRPK